MTLDGKKYDISYDTLPVMLKRKIDYRTISVIEIKISETEKRDVILHKIFTNLNNGGQGYPLRNYEMEFIHVHLAE